MGTYDVVVDHQAYLTSRPHRRAVHAGFRRAARKGLGRVVVAHEADGSCCQAQPWTATALRIQAALQADGLRAAWTFVDSDAAVVVMPRERAG